MDYGLCLVPQQNFQKQFILYGHFVGLLGRETSSPHGLCLGNLHYTVCSTPRTELKYRDKLMSLTGIRLNFVRHCVAIINYNAEALSTGSLKRGKKCV
jgi:hypothetical protein